MIETPPNSVAIAEPNQRERLIGLLSAMQDGWVDAFDFDGVHVQKIGESIGVSADETSSIRGGRLHLNGADLEQMAEWVENKAELYRDV